MEKTPTSPSPKIGDVGYVPIKGVYCRFTIVALFDELGGTMKVANGVSEWTCRQSEFIPEKEFKLRQLAEEEPKARERLAPILEAWEAGHKTANAICKFLADKKVHMHVLAIRAKMLECHRRGFFQLPLIDNCPSTK